jgi:hypothetical protein
MRADIDRVTTLRAGLHGEGSDIRIGAELDMGAQVLSSVMTEMDRAVCHTGEKSGFKLNGVAYHW